MPAAILCPGPSLSQTWPGQESGFELIIAVNRAGMLYPHDWLMMMDHNHVTYRIMAASSPRVGYLFPPHVACAAWGKDKPIRNPWTARPPRRVLRPSRLTGPTALQVAHEMGHTDIHIFGCDLAGDTYANGEPTPGDLAVRWSAERNIWARIMQYLETQGCRFTFHRPT